MPLFWSPRTIPELAEFMRLPSAERSLIWKRCWPKVLRHWQVWIAFVVCLTIGRAIWVFSSRWMAEFGVTGVVNGFISGFLGSVFFCMLILTLFLQVSIRGGRSCG